MFREIVHSIEASSTLRRRNLITQPSQATLDLCLRKAGSEKSRDYLDVIVSEKLRFFKSISSTLKRKTVDFKFVGFGERFRIGFGERFRKAPVSWGWGWVRLLRRAKLANPTLSTLKFCAGLQFSGDSIHAVNYRIK